MSDRTGIEWTGTREPNGEMRPGATWNPMTGCTEISAGCDNCYAATLARSSRMAPIYGKMLPVVDTPANREDTFAPRFWPDRLDQPIRWKRPRKIFVNSMSDVFHAHFTYEMIKQVFDVIVAAPQHTFLILTKRPERALRYADRLPWPPNLWFGTTVEDARVMHRVDTLRQIPAALRFISAEPLIGSLAGIDLTDIHWLIAGGESGTGFRALDLEWARELRDACREQGVAFFFKQVGGSTPKSGGKELDGETYCEFPDDRKTEVAA